MLTDADRIAADFAAIPFEDHEARVLAFAYLRLRSVDEAARAFVARYDAELGHATELSATLGMSEIRKALANV